MSDDWSADLQGLIAGLAPHLYELRRRLFIILIALTVGVVIGFVFAEPILNVLAQPVGGLQNLQAQAIRQRLAELGKLFGLVLRTISAAANGGQGHKRIPEFWTVGRNYNSMIHLYQNYLI